MTQKRKWSSLIIHHTAGGQHQSMDAVRRDQMRRGYADIAYHFCIVVDPQTGRGHLKRGRPDTMDGCHGNAHFNKHALAIVVFGNYDRYPPSEELYGDIAAGVKHVLSLYGVSPKKAFGHFEIKKMRPGEKTTATACPGKHFPLARLKRDISP
jgi:hypothetical protein